MGVGVDCSVFQLPGCTCSLPRIVIEEAGKTYDARLVMRLELTLL